MRSSFESGFSGTASPFCTGRKGGLVVGLEMLRPSSLVNSAVEVVL